MPNANIPPNCSEVYDFAHQRASIIPTAELAPEMTLIFVRRLGRLCWVNIAQATRCGHLPDPPHPAELFGATDVTPLPLEQLQEKVIREKLRDASVVLGIDNFTGSSAVFYGIELLQEIIRSNTPAPLRIISFLFDSRTDSLEYLYAAVKHLKGSCCYGGA